MMSWSLRWSKLLSSLVCAGSLSLPLGPPANAGDVLDALTSRGVLNCGVSEGIPGFSERDAAGRWQGFDVDVCRAVAAAALGDAEAVAFVPLRASTRFPALQARKIDLLLRNTSWTLTREAILKLQFPAVLLYDGQGFMVPADSPVRAPSELAGATVCIEKGTTHERNLRDYFGLRDLPVTPLAIDSATGVADAFRTGRCQSYSADVSQLAAARSRLPGGRQSWRILDERISKEPLAPVVWGGDQEWTTLVRWVIHTLILAEEWGATQANLDQVLAEGRTPLSRLSHDERALLARTLGLTPGWAARAVKAVGNYGELFERHLGPDSPLGLERGLNRLWTQGGLLYAPSID
ncbi:amino acid ABC transporter substrate-binding protein [Thiocystis violacea]|uniref:amino acid ABC transporter substrate-binding protein n=1 Tax=Thiocystis violacea TaxID=13725 RepID=UPI0019079B27|nr:amino acid ABC transporter substrate-binding protein [Thiocystis violacea]MBK1719153.1 ABC transporter substrate-binding protein [Thiocystis violacea]